MNKFALLSALILASAAGCQQNPSTEKKPGSYTAARHNQTGSHIPQPYSADSAGETYDPAQVEKMQSVQSSQRGR